jgi:hypothetical protein
MEDATCAVLRSGEGEVMDSLLGYRGSLVTTGSLLHHRIAETKITRRKGQESLSRNGQLADRLIRQTRACTQYVSAALIRENGSKEAQSLHTDGYAAKLDDGSQHEGRIALHSLAHCTGVDRLCLWFYL